MTRPEGSPAPVRLSDRDRGHLERAVALGRRGWGRVHPNPMVGCVLVRGEEVVGEGWHAEFGGPHAEVVALAAAGERARGAEAFVSLEPCRHTGKTPPCTRALEAAGIVRVVYGARDPGAESGGGGAELAGRGIEVVGPALSSFEAEWENPFFLQRREDRPWLALKLALSLDGKIAARPGTRTALSGPEATDEVFRLRAGFDAVLVGPRTAVVDDPLLTARGGVTPRVRPRRILLDPRREIGPGARALREAPEEVRIVTLPGAPSGWRRAIEGVGGRVIEVPGAPAGGADPRTEAGGAGGAPPSRFDTAALLGALRDDGIGSVLCEGGGRLAASLLGIRAVDRLYLSVSPRFLGEDGVPGFPGVSPSGWVPGSPPALLGRDLWIALAPGEAG